MAQNNCVQAIADYFDDSYYLSYNSNWYGAGKACTAIFTCGDQCPERGLSGQEVRARFEWLWEEGGCGKCGSAVFQDGTMVTLNECYAPCEDWHDGSLYAW